MWHSEAQGRISPLASKQGADDQVSNFPLLAEQGVLHVGQATGHVQPGPYPVVHQASDRPARLGTRQPQLLTARRGTWAGQEWGRDKDQEVQAESPWMSDLRARCVSRLPDPSSPGNSGFLPPGALLSPCPLCGLPAAPPQCYLPLLGGQGSDYAHCSPGLPALHHGSPHLLRHLHHRCRQVFGWGFQSSWGE